MPFAAMVIANFGARVLRVGHTSPAQFDDETPTSTPAPPCHLGQGGRSTLIEWGVAPATMEELTSAGVVVAR